MGTFYVPNEKGDARLSWNPANQDEVVVARETFASWQKKGYTTYRIDRRGAAGEPIKTFDPAASEILVLAPIAGG